jgi:hypothetical protein
MSARSQAEFLQTWFSQSQLEEKMKGRGSEELPKVCSMHTAVTSCKLLVYAKAQVKLTQQLKRI